MKMSMYRCGFEAHQGLLNTEEDRELFQTVHLFDPNVTPHSFSTCRQARQPNQSNLLPTLLPNNL